MVPERAGLGPLDDGFSSEPPSEGQYDEAPDNGSCKSVEIGLDCAMRSGARVATLQQKARNDEDREEKQGVKGLGHPVKA
jgi:hypothetical protein